MTRRAKGEGVSVISMCIGSEGGAGGWESGRKAVHTMTSRT